MCNRLLFGRYCCCCHLCKPSSQLKPNLELHTSYDSFGCPAVPNSNTPSSDYPKYTTSEEVRKLWEEWDASILILYILFTQLFLHLFGTYRTKATKTRIVSSLSAWFMYLLCELLAVISLGKLSKVERGKEPMSPFRIMWAPTILFYLGGPDTLTILNLQENSMWVKHLIALLTLGFRTSYVLYVSWTAELYSYLALLMLFPGMIKYGERVWIIRSRAEGNHQGFVQLNETEIAGKQPQEGKNVSTAKPGPKAKEVLQAYSYFQILNSHNPGPMWDSFTKEYNSATRAFKAIEIELGFLYDALFSKMGSIFTVWGCILRFLSFSFLVGVLVLILVMNKTSEVLFKIDFPISVMLLIGAIILEVAGILGQLVSDWAVVWASKYQFKLMKPIFSLQECFLSKRKRWSGFMGQLDLKNFCTKGKPTALIGLINALCGEDKMLRLKFSPYFEKVPAGLNDLVYQYLCGKSNKNQPGDQDSTGADPLQEFQWTIKLKFYESIIIWHKATEKFYAEDNPEAKPAPQEAEATKALSRYMMYLLVICPRFPFCRTGDGFVTACYEANEICVGKGSTASSKARNSPQPAESLVDRIQKLTSVLNEKRDRWEIMKKMWLKMLCSAARRCTAEQHAQELRHGVEFISHVWLLLVHRGEANWLDNNASLNLEGAADKSVEKTTENIVDFIQF